MLQQSSQHILSISHIPQHGAHPSLRADTLLHLLHVYDEGQVPEDCDIIEDEKGKKRAASPPAGGRRKRARTRRSPSPVISTDAILSEEMKKIEDERIIPVYVHTYEIEYSRPPEPHAGDEDNWGAHQRKLRDEAAGWLEEVSRWVEKNSADRIEPAIFDLGALNLYCMSTSGTAIARAKLPDAQLGHTFLPLCAMPQSHDFDTDAYGLPAGFQDPLTAFCVLQAANRIKIHLRVHLVANSGALKAEPNTSMLPFKLRLDLEVALRPVILEPVFQATIKATTEVEDAQRRTFLQVFQTSGIPPPSFQGSVDIPLLYSILGPAPHLSSPLQESGLQPKALLPTLLPFQRRSIAWLLKREGKAIDKCGEVTKGPASLPPDARDELPLFWEEVHVNGERWYWNRVRGVLSSTLPKEEPALGGILAEEPGLGKTLECIALILLNPAVQRGPHNKRWDPEAKVHVKETKTTLIVTPASLAPQWADELALHAPGLKVLIYNGWSKVPVPITEGDIKKARAKRVQPKKRPTASRSRGARTTATTRLATRQRGKGKQQRVEVISDTESDASDAESQDADDGLIDWCAYVNTFDVCITTYNILQQDLGVARPPPNRPRRANAHYNDQERPRSPLIMCEWYRVIMDEVQMVGGGKTEEMVALIPRLSSFAVSGTPARAQVADLIHVLKFLRVAPVTSSARVWARLQRPGYVQEFTSLFQRFALRTMKASVRDELTIPQQTRFLVPIELGKIERHVYDGSFEHALLELGLDARGVAVRKEWEVDTAVLRSWLRRLRGICTHPQVGQLQNQADKASKRGVLKTIGEVLEGMRDQNWRNLMDDRRSQIQGMTTIAMLRQRDEQDHTRYRAALDILLAAEKEIYRLIDEVKVAIAVHSKKGEAIRAEARQLRESHGLPPHIDRPEEDSQEESSQGKSRGKEKGRAVSPSERSDPSGFEDDENLPRNRAGEEHATAKQALQIRLRECNITLHKVLFLKGDVYHVLGESYADLENGAYAVAEEMRRLLLKSTEEAAKKAMHQLSRNAAVKDIKEKDLYITVPYCGKGGIKSAHLVDEANEIIDELLNQQSMVLWKWREKLIALLTQSLTSGEDDADGQEYARSLETQGEAEAYLQAYAALLADRRETLTSERTLLAAHDVRETKARNTKAARKAEGANTWFLNEAEEVVELEQLNDIEGLPEHAVLFKELNDERKNLLEEFGSERAIKSVMVDLNKIVTTTNRNDDPEKILARDGASRLRTLISEQSKLMDRLQTDLAHLRKAFNERISYFRQLQEISDTVAEADWEGDVRDALVTTQASQNELEAKINTGRARQRYLDHLAKTQEDGSVDEEERCCTLCRCDFTRGYITQCAHVFCEACLKSWLQRPEGKACPVCRVVINPDQLQRFLIDERAGTAPAAPTRFVNNEPIPRSQRPIEYNKIDPQLFEDIQTMESLGSFGSKIQTLVRHLLYLAIADPGSKSIIFSAWADSLTIIQYALSSNGISCLRIDQQMGKQNVAKKFRTDPSISVLLLHGERENAGLNVTCASRVFLVESVVHHAFELQAIARIDRMGQSKPTEVYCYYAEDTVERNILDLAAKQGQSLYTKENSAGTLNATAFTMSPSKKEVDAPAARRVQKGDFVFKTDDMLAIFFPHLFEDVEYLIPAEDLTLQADMEEEARYAYPETGPSGNAIAGPSRWN